MNSMREGILPVLFMAIALIPRRCSVTTCWPDFPGGAVVKNPPANAGDMGSSPGPGRSHMLWSN